MLGLRLAEGVDTSGFTLDAARTKAAGRLVQRGLLEIDGDRWRIPQSKWLFADGAIAELM